MSVTGRLVQWIGIVTLITGCVQMASPATMLSLVGADASPAARHFFAIVGMFMALFGGATAYAVRELNPPILVVSALQKFGASAAVALGIANSIFSPLAWLVSGFDLLGGVLAFLFWRQVRPRR